MNHLLSLLRKMVINSGELAGNRHKDSEFWLLLIRNILVFVAAVLFIAGMFQISHRFLLKAIAYIMGAGAYLCEILILTDIFSRKIPFRDKFMAYCFGGLYILMAISYFLEHYES